MSTGAERAAMAFGQHQVEHHVPDRACEFGAAEMAAANPAHLDAERQLVEQHRRSSGLAIGLAKVIGRGRRQFAAATSQQLMDLVDTRFQLGNFLIRKLLHACVPLGVPQSQAGALRFRLDELAA